VVSCRGKQVSLWRWVDKEKDDGGKAVWDGRGSGAGE
jgi:hypothetical protein